MDVFLTCSKPLCEGEGDNGREGKEVGMEREVEN